MTGFVHAQRPLAPVVADTSAAAGAKRDLPAKTGPKSFKEFITK